MAQGRSGRVWEISPSPGFDHRTVQPVAAAAAAAVVVVVIVQNKADVFNANFH